MAVELLAGAVLDGSSHGAGVVAVDRVGADVRALGFCDEARRRPAHGDALVALGDLTALVAAAAGTRLAERGVDLDAPLPEGPTLAECLAQRAGMVDPVEAGPVVHLDRWRADADRWVRAGDRADGGPLAWWHWTATALAIAELTARTGRPWDALAATILRTLDARSMATAPVDLIGRDVLTRGPVGADAASIARGVHLTLADLGALFADGLDDPSGWRPSVLRPGTWRLDDAEVGLATWHHDGVRLAVVAPGPGVAQAVAAAALDAIAPPLSGDEAGVGVPDAAAGEWVGPLAAALGARGPSAAEIRDLAADRGELVVVSPRLADGTAVWERHRRRGPPVLGLLAGVGDAAAVVAEGADAGVEVVVASSSVLTVDGRPRFALVTSGGDTDVVGQASTGARRP